MISMYLVRFPYVTGLLIILLLIRLVLFTLNAVSNQALKPSAVNAWKPTLNPVTVNSRASIHNSQPPPPPCFPRRHHEPPEIPP
jgi:hypothetical protein